MREGELYKAVAGRFATVAEKWCDKAKVNMDYGARMSLSLTAFMILSLALAIPAFCLWLWNAAKWLTQKRVASEK